MNSFVTLNFRIGCSAMSSVIDNDDTNKSNELLTKI